MITIGIGEYAITDNHNESIITHALGSCVAIIIHCRKTRYTAMAHVVLPKKIGRNSVDKEAYYADATLNGMLNIFMSKLQCEKRYLDITLVGGAETLRFNDQFQIGSKNLEVLRDILKEQYLIFTDEETGGSFSRTVSVKVKNGKIKISKRKMLI